MGRPPFNDLPTAALWREYNRDRSRELRDRLVEAHLHMATGAARAIGRRLPRHVDRDELESAAMIALVDVVERFEPWRGIAFASFALPRIRGAILDRLRAMDHVSRVRRTKQKAREAIEQAAACRGERLDEGELCRELGWEWSEMAGPPPEVLSLDRVLREDNGDGRSTVHSLVGSRVHRGDVQWFFERVTRSLSIESQIALYLSIVLGVRMAAIGELFGVSESLISQRITRALADCRRDRGRDDVLADYQHSRP